MEKKREIRSFEGVAKPRIREAQEKETQSRTIMGYSIVFDTPSVLLMDGWSDPYREIIEKTAITRDSLDKMDIKMTLWHNREKLLARSTRGEGTLTLEVDNIGVRYEFEAPCTPDGETALELVRRGDLAGSSFIYWSDDSSSVHYAKDEEGVLTRYVDRIDEIYDMTIASDPAYQSTSVTAREIPLVTQTSTGNGQSIKELREFITKQIKR